MANQDLEPAATIIAKIGGPRAVAEITGRNISRVYRWMRGREEGGTDGKIPHRAAEVLLDHAAKNGGDLTPADFFQGSRAQ